MLKSIVFFIFLSTLSVAQTLEIMKIVNIDKQALKQELENLTEYKLINDYNFMNLYYNPKQLDDRKKFEAFILKNQDVFEIHLSKKLNLYFAIMMNNPNLVKKYIKKGTKVNSYYLSVLKEKGSYIQKRYFVYEILKFYKLKNSEVVLMINNLNPFKHKIDNLFKRAIKNENIEQIKYLLKNGADINGGAYNIPIIDSVNNTEILKLLILNNADVNSGYANGTTALINAVKKENAESAKLLLEQGVNINSSYGAKYGAKYTPIQIAVLNNDKKMIKLLQEYGADSVLYAKIQNKINSAKESIYKIAVGVGFSSGMLFYLIGVEMSGEY
jgi:ankyrin repeat protein